MNGYENSIRFLVREHGKTMMKCNDFTAVYSKHYLKYTDIIRFCYMLGAIPGDKVINEILSKKIQIIKRVQ